VIGVSRKNALEALKKYSLGNPVERDSKTAFIVMYQIERQLEAFAEYSRIIGKKSHPHALSAAVEYERALTDFRSATQKRFDTLGVDREKVAAFAKTEPVTTLILNKLAALLAEAEARNVK